MLSEGFRLYTPNERWRYWSVSDIDRFHTPYGSGIWFFNSFEEEE